MPVGDGVVLEIRELYDSCSLAPANTRAARKEQRLRRQAEQNASSL